jgi:hypothetical protein
MASSTSIPLHVLEWYEIRDRFLGENNQTQNIQKALTLAASCAHPDAQWLSSVCSGRDVRSLRGAAEVFGFFGETDARALCFAWLCGNLEDLAPLRRSATLGCAFAQAFLAGKSFGTERFALAQSSALQGERDGFYWLGKCWRDGEGCDQDFDRAKQCFLFAAERNDVWAAVKTVHPFSIRC